MMRRRARTATRVVLGLVVASTFVNGTPGEGTTPAAAQTAAALAGLQGRAAASGIHVLYAPQGLLPISPLADIGAPDALATIASGPSTFARASVADPGDILANPDAVFALADPNYPAGSIPPYPYRVSATSGVGEPTAESNPAPGMHARVEVSPTGSTAFATLPAADAPAFATVGSVESTATTLSEGGTATVTARTVVTDLNVLGLLTVDSIVTTVTATADGVETIVEGGTTVTGAAFLGQPVTIDAEGIHAGSPSAPPDPVLGAVLPGLQGGLDDGLRDAGIRISLARPVEATGDTSGQLASSGLRIDLELSERTMPVIGQLADALPPMENPVPGAPSIEDLVAAARATHLTTIEFGRAEVSLTARALPARSTAPTSGSLGSGAPGSGALAGSLVGAPPTRAPLAAPTSGAGAPAAVPVGTTQTPATTLAAGVGALAVLALLAQPFAGSRLARLPAALLATDSAAACPRETR